MADPYGLMNNTGGYDVKWRYQGVSGSNTLQSQARSSLNDMAYSISLINAGANIQVNNILSGAEMSAQGRLLSAQGFRQASGLLAQSTEFNLAVDANNTIRRLKSLSSDYQLIAGRQIAQQAATGFGVGSKSFDIARQETLQSTQRKILQTKIDAENNIKAKLFETGIAQTNLENQARASEYQAQVDRILAQNEARAVRFSANAQIAQANRNLNKTIGSLF